jgi:hypothetical protein
VDVNGDVSIDALKAHNRKCDTKADDQDYKCRLCGVVFGDEVEVTDKSKKPTTNNDGSVTVPKKIALQRWKGSVIYRHKMDHIRGEVRR